MVVWSFIVTFCSLVINLEPLIIIATKLFLILGLWFMISDRNIRQRVGFYKISGVSNIKFFAVIFIVDSVLTALFLSIVQGFI